MRSPQSHSDDAFFERVWAVVARIPSGKVTTYGHIAGYLGARSAARTVGWALGAAAGTGLPCHRVVNRFGALTGKMRFEGPHVMEERLRAEGDVRRGGMRGAGGAFVGPVRGNRS